MVFTSITAKVFTHEECGWSCITIDDMSRCMKCNQLAHDETNPDAYQQFTYVHLPNPFTTNTARCILLKPSKGTFYEYNVGDDLHIGISDSESMVHSYWFQGIIIESSSWQDAICIYKFQEIDESLSEFVSNYSHHFTAERYDTDTWNCFNFVIMFMRYLASRHSADQPIPRSITTKDEFVSSFIELPLQRTMRYCRLIERLQQTRYEPLSSLNLS